MTTAEDAVIQSAHDRLACDVAPVPNYVIATLVSAIPAFSADTPMYREAKWNDDDSVTWRIIAVSNQCLVRITLTGPVPDNWTPSPPFQATEQAVTIEPITGSVNKVTATVKDTTRSHEASIHWQTSWTIHFADATSLTVPTERDAKRHDATARAQAEEFVQAILERALR